MTNSALLVPENGSERTERIYEAVLRNRVAVRLIGALIVLVGYAAIIDRPEPNLTPQEPVTDSFARSQRSAAASVLEPVSMSPSFAPEGRSSSGHEGDDGFRPPEAKATHILAEGWANASSQVSRQSRITAGPKPKPAVPKQNGSRKSTDSEPAPGRRSGGVSIQLASLRTMDKAEHEWLRLQTAFPKILRGTQRTIRAVRIRERGNFYRLHAGPFPTVQFARSVCAQLKSRKQGCLIAARPPGGAGDSGHSRPSVQKRADDGRLVFAAGSANLPNGARVEIARLAKRFHQETDRRIKLLAYAKGQSVDRRTQRRLSLSRALAVRALLVELGVPPMRITVRALGNDGQREPAERVDLILARRS